MAKVCIDAGHYGKYNRCPANTAYYESDMAWRLSELQAKYLKKLGIDVVLTRANKDKDLDLSTRGRKAEGCDLFISNHSNAVGDKMNEDVDYVAVYHLVDDSSVKCDDESKEIANILAPNIANVMGVRQGYRVLSRKSSNDRNGDGVMNDNYYGVLHGARQVKVAGLILEHSFHTNSKVVKWLLNDDNLDKLAKTEAECIATYLLGKEVRADNTQTVQTTKYIVQCGAYRLKENALRYQVDIEKLGFKSVVVKSNGLFKLQVGVYSSKAKADKMIKKLRSKGIEALTLCRDESASSLVGALSIDEVARQVIAGVYGNGAERKARLVAKGYNYASVQARVNELTK